MDKIKIGVTGQKGFVGTHLYNTLCLSPNKFEKIDYNELLKQQLYKLM